MLIKNIVIYFIIMVSFLLFPVCSWPSIITEGNQYIRLSCPMYDAPKLLEFFSFYCSHCYQFEQIYNIPYNIQKKLSKNIVFYKYHINFLGNFGQQLTHAWAVAIALGIEDRVSSVLFTAIQKQNSINSVEDIKNKFIQSGISESEYDTAWNSILVKSLVLDQEKAAIQFQLRGVPAIVVKGKFMIQNDKLDLSSINAYVNQFSEVLQFLIEKT